MPQEASRLLQDGILEPIWTQHGPKLAPSWLKLGLCWPQVGSNLAQVGPMLAPDPGPQPPLSQPKPFQIPSQALQDPIKEATPHPPGLGSRIWSLGSAFWTSQTPNLDPKTARHGSKKDLPRLQILQPRPGGWGVASYIYIYIYIYIHENIEEKSMFFRVRPCRSNSIYQTPLSTSKSA